MIGPGSDKKSDLGAKQSWIYPVLFMSVGPVGPGGGVYSIVEVVVYKFTHDTITYP